MNDSAAPIVRQMNCPMCGAVHEVGVRECQACGEFFPSGDIWRQGDLLVMHRSAELPYRCIKTNRPADGFVTYDLSWQRLPVEFAIAIPVLYRVLSAATAQNATISMPVGDGALRRCRNFVIAAWACRIVGVAMIILPMVFARGPSLAMFDVIIALLIAGMLIAILGSKICAGEARLVTPVKITRTHVWISGVHPEYLAQFPEFDG